MHQELSEFVDHRQHPATLEERPHRLFPGTVAPDFEPPHSCIARYNSQDLSADHLSGRGGKPSVQFIRKKVDQP
jgi:hypothetical protein